MQTAEKRILEKIRTKYRPEEYPCLIDQTARWRATQPLDGIRILDSTPIFHNTLTKYSSLLEAGAKLTVGLSPLITVDTETVDFLRKIGIPILSPEERSAPFDLILDCAGAFSKWKPRIGFVELTRSGVAAYRDASKPVFIADSGAIKKIETSLGTGESYFRAMQKLGYTEWKDRSLIVFGSGKVGSGIISFAHHLGAHISVITDPSSVSPKFAPYIHQIIDLSDRAAIGKAIREAYAVVTATGIAGAFEQTCESTILEKSKAILANMGVEDEFGSSIPPERVLNRKKTLNFILNEPTHLKYIEATMALHNEGALYLLTHPETQGLVSPPPELEEMLLNSIRKHGIIQKELNLIL